MATIIGDLLQLQNMENLALRQENDSLRTRAQHTLNIAREVIQGRLEEH